MSDASEQLAGDAVTFTAELGDGIGVLRIEGELDAAGAPDLRAECEQLRAAGARSLVLDLSGTTFIDSSGLGALLAIERDLSASGGALRLRAPHAAVARLLEITGLSDHFALEA